MYCLWTIYKEKQNKTEKTQKFKEAGEYTYRYIGEDIFIKLEAKTNHAFSKYWLKEILMIYIEEYLLIKLHFYRKH